MDGAAAAAMRQLDGSVACSVPGDCHPRTEGKSGHCHSLAFPPSSRTSAPPSAGDLLHSPAQVRDLPGTHTYHAELPAAGVSLGLGPGHTHMPWSDQLLKERNISIFAGTDSLSTYQSYESLNGNARGHCGG